MNARERSFRRKIAYLLAIIVLLGFIAWIGRPSSSTGEGGMLAKMRTDHGLNQSHLGEIDPASETIKLASLGLRGVATIILWEKANEFKREKDWVNLRATIEQLTKLQPNFVSVWLFQGWTMSYNVSVEFDDVRERYRWVINGINFMKRGTKYNSREPKIPMEIGRVVSQKIGRADERKQFRYLFVNDDDFHGSRHPMQRDNWLVGKWWYRNAEALIEKEKVYPGNMNPPVYRSHAPMCQMSYAEALEGDGFFDQRAKKAWKDAASDWHTYGELPFQTTYNVGDKPLVYSMNQLDKFEADAAALIDELYSLAPGQYEKIKEEKLAGLKQEQREALETPYAERTPEQEQLALVAEDLVKVTHEDVAKRALAENRAQAIDVVKRLLVTEQIADFIRHERRPINYGYWKLRAQVEQEDETLNARKLIHDGDQAYAEADLQSAKENYEQGLAAWRSVLDTYPELVEELTFGRDLMDMIIEYRRVLRQLDEPFPTDFILQDVMDLHEVDQ